MYAFARESGHAIWKERWYALALGVSLQIDLYMTREDQVFVANVVVTDLTEETMASSVITRPVGVAMKLNVIAKIRKYKGLHEGHHFIPMAWRCTMHLLVIWIVSSRNVPIFFTIDNQEVIYPYLFTFNFSSIVLILSFSVFNL
jgi:hypothetical protein